MPEIDHPVPQPSLPPREIIIGDVVEPDKEPTPPQPEPVKH